MMRQAFLNYVKTLVNYDEQIVKTYLREMDHDGLWKDFGSLEDVFEDYLRYRGSYLATFRR